MWTSLNAVVTVVTISRRSTITFDCFEGPNSITFSGTYMVRTCTCVPYTCMHTRMHACILIDLHVRTVPYTCMHTRYMYAYMYTLSGPSVASIVTWTGGCAGCDEGSPNDQLLPVGAAHPSIPGRPRLRAVSPLEVRQHARPYSKDFYGLHIFYSFISQISLSCGTHDREGRWTQQIPFYGLRNSYFSDIFTCKKHKIPLHGLHKSVVAYHA